MFRISSQTLGFSSRDAIRHRCGTAGKHVSDCSSGSSDSASDSSDFEGAIGGATIGDIVQPFSEIQPWRFEPPARSTVSPVRVENPETPRRRCELDSEEW